MKLIRKKGNLKDSSATTQKPKAGPSVWKILGIDDEADIHDAFSLG